MNGTASPADPHPQWFAEFIATHQQWDDAVRATPDGDDTPETVDLWDAREALCLKLATTPVMTIEGAAAQLDFMLRDEIIGRSKTATAANTRRSRR